MNKKFLFFATIGILVASAFVLSRQKQMEKSKNTGLQPAISIQPTTAMTQEVNYKASFAIFTHGTFRVFTAAMYHNQSGDVYIEAENPNIVQVKKSNTIWNDFFKTLPFKLTKNCLKTGTGETFCSNNKDKLRFFLNGREDPNALNKEIKSKDQLLVTYGNEDELQIQNQLKRIPAIK